MELGSPRMLVDVDGDLEAAPKTASPARPATYAINALYTAFSDYRGVFSRKLSAHDVYSRLFRYEEDRPRFEPVLAFSPTRLNLLAIATGLQILIFDVESKRVKFALKGNGRVVTAVALCAIKSSILATGHVDGSICVWSLEHPSRPMHHLRAFHGACSHVSFNPLDSDQLAGCHQDCISVWCMPSTRPVLVTRSKDSGIRSLYWFSRQPERVIGMSSSGSVSIYDVHPALKTFKAGPLASNEDDENEHLVFGRLGDLGYMPSSTFDLGFSIAQALLVGGNGLIVLPRLGRVLFFITFMGDNEGPTELWRLCLDAQVDCFSLRRSGHAVEVVACLGTDTQVFEVPAPVLDGMSWLPSMGLNIVQDDDKDSTGDTSLSGMGLMRPELSFYQRMATAPAAKSSAPIANGPSPKLKQEPTKRPKFRSVDQERYRSQTATPQSMTSSLELPIPEENDEYDSPMPFLSPAIPARKGSPAPLTSLAETILLLPPRASFDSATSADHDSDSDDETFAENMQGSGSFLPGGVHVPLPRTCGAAFAPNGQLLTFFLSTARPMSVGIEDQTDNTGISQVQDSETSRLFPSFGLLHPPPRAPTEGEDDGQNSGDKDDLQRPSFVLRTPSHDHKPWSAKVSPVKSQFHGLPGPRRVRVTVRELKSLEPTKRSLAEQYSLFSENDESIAELCRINANAAFDAGLEDVATLWQLLALVLEQRIVAGSLSSDHDSLPHVFGQRPSMPRNPSMASNNSQLTKRSAVSKLHWMQHPFGRYWAVQAMLDWAEKKADIQVLACVSALLLRAADALQRDHTSHASRPITPADSFVQQPTDFEPTRIKPTVLLPGIPLLRTDTGLTDVSFADDSPVKPLGSQLSSRNTSQPTTPHLDSSSSTPPYMLPTLHRQSSRLSNSGSASPETHRASFSQAAKYYAQTITDKLAGYGSSPPMKKMAGSPSANELSSSLPTTTPGSWAKSVSFASAISTERNSERSLSLAQEDDNYDSDKTIDDSSLPHTPKHINTEVSVKLNKEAQFFDEPVTSFDASFMPKGYNSKAQVWRDCYAEQLRSWDLLIEAAELENIPDPETHGSADEAEQRLHVAPHIPKGERGAICSICLCLVQAAEEICPACLHTTHPACLEDLLNALGEDVFTCPSGCGCECTSVTDISYGVDEGDAVSVVGLHQAETGISSIPQFLKKRSLTDPRALRHRLEGDSW